MQKYKKIQLKNKVKYEVRLARNLSSFSGCVGFGLDRWIIGFLTQYGIDERKWPDIVREKLKKYVD
jgi:seryl-tRNA synthetase